MKAKGPGALCLCLLAAGLLVWWGKQHHTSAQLRQELGSLQPQLGALTALRAENQALSDTIARHAADRAAVARQLAELQRLRQEAADLRLELASLRKTPGWSYQGYATPEAAFQSTLYAMSRGDLEAYLSALPLDQQDEIVGELNRAPDTDLSAALDRMRADVFRYARHLSGAQMLRVELQPNEEALLTLAIPHESAEPGIEKIRLKQVEGTWRWLGGASADTY